MKYFFIMNRQIFFNVMTVISTVVLVFVSCGKDNGDASFNVVESVSGTLDLEYAEYDLMILSLDQGRTRAVTVPISDGKFNLTLPVPDEKYLHNLLDKNVKCVAARFFIRNSEDDSSDDNSYRRFLKLHGTSSKGNFFVDFIYVTENVNINQTYSFGTELFKVRLKKGWNAVVVYFQGETDDKPEYTYTTEPIPPEAKWMDF